MMLLKLLYHPQFYINCQQQQREQKKREREEEKIVLTDYNYI
jgi:hypothetical protein